MKSTKITTDTLPIFLKLQKLKDLKLSGTVIDDGFAKAIAEGLPQLQSFEVTNTEVSESVIQEIVSKFPKLKIQR